MKSLDVPIYGSSLTNGLIRVKLREHGLAGETVAPFASVYNQQLAWNFGGYTSNSISSDEPLSLIL